MNRTHTRYNRYANPYASPPALIDQSICGDCEGPTGLDGESLYEALCADCTASWQVYTAYQEEEIP